MHVPFAFSVSHFVSSVGADAGFAAIIGLAILVLLYFAQARETSTLRDQATSASQRVEQLERRLAQLGKPQVAPAPRSVGAPATRAGTAPAGAPRSVPAPVAADAKAIPMAPAGVGAPALIDATRLIPAPELARRDTAAAAAKAAPATASPAAGTASGAPGAPGSASGPPPIAGSEPGVSPVAGSEPSAESAATAATPASPSSPTALVTPQPATAAAGALQPASGSNGAGERPPAAAADVAPRIQIPSERSLPHPPFSLGAARQPSAGRRWLAAGLTVLILIAVAAVLLVVTSTGGSQHKVGATSSTNAPTPSNGLAVKPSSVTVAVLNGTDVSQLAHRIAQRLIRTGYREGTVATAADQTETSTVVAYLPGYRRDAAQVATALKLPSSRVQPASQSARAVACPPPSACRANVIVTIGSDLASTQ